MANTDMNALSFYFQVDAFTNSQTFRGPAMPDSTLYWINGRLLPEQEAVIPVTDHGLL